MRQCRVGTGEWQYGRSCLTEDVNQVIQGAFDGGEFQQDGCVVSFSADDMIDGFDLLNKLVFFQKKSILSDVPFCS